MFSLIMKRVGLLAAAALALCAFLAVGSASAATQHWATSSQVPYGSSQSYSGKATTNFILSWEISTAEMTIICGGLSTSGQVENPPGGGAGSLSAESFKLENCGTNMSPCALVGNSISFVPLHGTAATVSGHDKVTYEAASGKGGKLGELEIAGKSCLLDGSYPIWGSFAAEPEAAHPGQYFVESDFSMSGPYWLSMEGGFKIESPSKEGVALSSGASPGSPHWYLGSTQWNNLSAGKSVGYSTNGPLSLSLKGEEYGAPFEFICAGGNLKGSAENPSGGGSGTASATLSLGECHLSSLLTKLHCTLSVSVSPGQLSGTVTEVGESKSPAVEFLTASEGEIATFKIAGSDCPVPGSYPLEGSLAASSEGAGYFNLAASELFVSDEEFTATGGFALETEAGQMLRLQP